MRLTLAAMPPEPIPMPAPEPPLERFGRLAGQWAYRARTASQRWGGKLRDEPPATLSADWREHQSGRALARKLALATAAGFLVGVASGWRRGRRKQERRRHGHPLAS